MDLEYVSVENSKCHREYYPLELNKPTTLPQKDTRSSANHRVSMFFENYSIKDSVGKHMLNSTYIICIVAIAALIQSVPTVTQLFFF